MHLIADARQRAEVMRKHDANHGRKESLQKTTKVTKTGPKGAATCGISIPWFSSSPSVEFIYSLRQCLRFHGKNRREIPHDGRPVIAGVGGMKFRTFLAFNVVGAFVWVWSMLGIGYFLGPFAGGIFWIYFFDRVHQANGPLGLMWDVVLGVIIAKVNNWGNKIPDSGANPGPQGG